jgi:hypothetical protein
VKGANDDRPDRIREWHDGLLELTATGTREIARGSRNRRLTSIGFHPHHALCRLYRLISRRDAELAIAAKGPRYYGKNDFVRYRISDLDTRMSARADEIRDVPPMHIEPTPAEGPRHARMQQENWSADPVVATPDHQPASLKRLI